MSFAPYAMNSIMAKLTSKQLQKRDAGRDIGEELLQAVRDMKRGRAARTHNVETPVAAAARAKTGLTQAQFATLGCEIKGKARQVCVPVDVQVGAVQDGVDPAVPDVEGAVLEERAGVVHGDEAPGEGVGRARGRIDGVCRHLAPPGVGQA